MQRLEDRLAGVILICPLARFSCIYSSRQNIKKLTTFFSKNRKMSTCIIIIVVGSRFSEKIDKALGTVLGSNHIVIIYIAYY